MTEARMLFAASNLYFVTRLLRNEKISKYFTTKVILQILHDKTNKMGTKMC